MTRFTTRLPSLGRWYPSLAFGRRRIGGRWPTRVRGVLMPSRFERFQAFEEGAHHQTYTHRGLVPIFGWYTQSLWKGWRIKPIAHDAVSSCLVSPSLSQNIWEVSRKVAGEGSATRCRPRDHIRCARLGSTRPQKLSAGFSSCIWGWFSCAIHAGLGSPPPEEKVIPCILHRMNRRSHSFFLPIGQDRHFCLKSSSARHICVTSGNSHHV